MTKTKKQKKIPKKPQVSQHTSFPGHVRMCSLRNRQKAHTFRIKWCCADPALISASTHYPLHWGSPAHSPAFQTRSTHLGGCCQGATRGHPHTANLRFQHSWERKKAFTLALQQSQIRKGMQRINGPRDGDLRAHAAGVGVGWATATPAPNCPQTKESHGKWLVYIKMNLFTQVTWCHRENSKVPQQTKGWGPSGDRGIIHW